MSRRTRPPIVQEAVIEYVRSRIMSGRFRPGERLPSRLELARRLSTTAVTVQRAFARLEGLGFVRSDGPRGTFVSERPPHEFRYVLVFPLERSEPGWVRFWTVLCDVAHELSRAGPLRIDIATGVDGKADSAGFRALLEDVRDKNLAGLIFATNPFLVRGTPLLDAPWPPRVAIMPPPAAPGVTAIDLDRRAFRRRAVEALAARSRRRVAFITVPGLREERFEALAEELSPRGLLIRREWVQAVPQSDPAWAENVAMLMFGDRTVERPDGLVITDDNLVEHACRGLVASGVRVPEELDVIAHCNFPAPAPKVLEVSRLGFDIRALLRRCISVLQERRLGGEVRDAVLEPVFETELAEEVLDEKEMDSSRRASACS